MATKKPKASQCEIKTDPNDGSLWVYYPHGWKSGSDPMGCQHQDHIDNKSEVRSSIKDAIPCDCEDCI
jgi:hypothetical protein